MVKKRKNKGSATIESCIVVPLFLFFMLYNIYIYRLFYVNARIHQCLAEASFYCAERCYLEDKLMSVEEGQESRTDVGALVNTGIVYNRFRSYMGDEPILEGLVAGGKNGIIITVLPDSRDKKVFLAKAVYYAKINIPLLGTYTMPESVEIKQKAFLGYGSDGNIDDDEVYVYITPNEEVYHLSRECSHLARSIRKKTVGSHSGYLPCSFCVKSDEKGEVYVTESGEAYHQNPKCLGLKRTVTRVRKSSVSGLPACSRCGR